MSETRQRSGSAGKQGYPRRRFLGVFGGLVAGLWGGVIGSGAPAATGPRELPLKEADYYRPHDLAG